MASKKKRLEDIEKLLNIDEHYKPGLSYCDLISKVCTLERKEKENKNELMAINEQLKGRVEYKKDGKFYSPKLIRTNAYPEPPIRECLQMLFDYLGIEIKKTELKATVKIVKKKSKKKGEKNGTHKTWSYERSALRQKAEG